jgi:hypothetical protein
LWEVKRRGATNSAGSVSWTRCFEETTSRQLRESGRRRGSNAAMLLQVPYGPTKRRVRGNGSRLIRFAIRCSAHPTSFRACQENGSSQLKFREIGQLIKSLSISPTRNWFGYANQDGLDARATTPVHLQPGSVGRARFRIPQTSFPREGRPCRRSVRCKPLHFRSLSGHIEHA